MKKSITLISIMSLIFIFILSGCSSKEKENKEVNSSGIKVLTSFYPMYIETLNVVKNVPGVSVSNLTEKTTGCLHDYSLTTSDMKKLEEAQVFVINGAGMESFMDKVTSERKNLKVIEASKGIELIKGHGDEGDNPHVWVSTSNSIIQVRNIEEQISAIDPSNASLYKANADEYVKKLEEKSKKMHVSLDNIENKDIVTFHEAFPYFAKEFNLNVVGVIEREPGSEPSAKELDETIKEIKRLKVKALFAEPQYPTKAIDVIAKETGAKVYILDPGVTGDMTEDAYLNLMDKNLKVLEEALK